MTLIDTHSHIYTEEFPDIENILANAQKEGIESILLPAIDSETHEKLIQLAQHYATCKPMMGLHPCSVGENYRKELDFVWHYLNQQDFVAIGEIGLDYHWDTTFKAEQMEAFSIQMEWAKEKNKPIAIHSRNATIDCIKMVKKQHNSQLRGVFHCFSGSIAEAEEIIQMGFFLGIGGVLTFKNSGLDKVVAQIPMDSIILETDAPYLAPVPFRGKRNEPAYLKYVVEKLAAIKNLPVEEVAEITTKNAKKLFSL